MTPYEGRPEFIYEMSQVVRHPEHGFGVIVMQYINRRDEGRGPWFYDITVNFYKKQLIVGPSDIRPLTLKEFALYRHPPGEWMPGKNGAIGAGIRYAAFLAFSIYGATQVPLSPYWLIMVAAPLAVIGLMVRGLVRNFEGKRM